MAENDETTRRWGFDESTPLVILGVLLAIIFKTSDLQWEISLMAILFAALIYQIEKYYRGSIRGISFYIGYSLFIIAVLATFNIANFRYDLSAVFSGVFVMIEAAIFFWIFPRVEPF